MLVFYPGFDADIPLDAASGNHFLVLTLDLTVINESPIQLIASFSHPYDYQIH